jgi:N-acyl-D-amino-acid deacylase
MGMAARQPSAGELRRMVALAGEALDAGALGLSTGLWYAPGSYARPGEIEAVARETARRGRLYSSHVRSESDQGQGVFAAHREAIDIGRRTGARVQISHIKMVGTEFRGRGLELLQQIDVARDEGVDVAADVYPYAWSATSLSGALLPRWVLADGHKAMLNRLRDPADQRRLRAEVERGLARYQGPAGVVIARYPPNPDIEGLSLEQIAVAGHDPFDAVVGLITEGDGSVVVHAIDEEDMTTFSLSAHVAVASDGNSLRATGPLSTGTPHPRSYGTFPRFLALMASPKGQLRFEQAIRKMTSLPAQRLGLTRRGRIGVGAAADLLVIDHAALADKSSYQDPHRYPSGVEHVIVNGRIALTHGQPTGVLAGRVIRSPAG